MAWQYRRSDIPASGSRPRSHRGYVYFIAANSSDAGKIDCAVFARTSNAVLIVPGNTPAVIHERGFVAAGALISYGADLVDLFGRAAGYGYSTSQQRTF